MPIQIRSVALVLGLAVIAGGGTAAAQSPSPPAPPPLFDDTSIPAVAVPGGIVDPQAATWDHVSIWPDGRTLTVAFWNGAEACSGLDRLEVTDDAGTLRITPWVGTRVDAAGADCADIRQLYSAVVTLDAPILAGGTSGPFDVAFPAHGSLAERGGPFASLGSAGWEMVDLGPDGRTGWAFFTGGDEACWAFDEVRVESAGSVPRVVIGVGELVGTPETCTMIAIALRAAVTLPAPIILGGQPT